MPDRRPLFNRRDPARYIAEVHAYAQVHIVVCKAFAVHVLRHREVTGPSPAVIASTVAMLRSALRALHQQGASKGAHLETMVEDIEDALSSLEDLTRRCRLRPRP